MRQDRSDDGSMKSEDRLSVGSGGSGRGGKGQTARSSGSIRSRSSSSSKKSKKLEADFISAQFAKDLKTNNLKHRPLPDSVDDKLFKALQMQGVKHPGAELDYVPTACAVGHKKYVSPGPTQCSKLKVYRPKTAAPPPISKVLDERPKTGKIKDLTEIDLAICWDLLPPRPEDEPKRPTHIDGSNGSAAPGIFTLVNHPEQDSSSLPSPKDSSKSKKKSNGKPKTKAAWPDISEKSKPVNPSAVMDIINNNIDIPTGKVTEHQPHRRYSLDKSNGHLVPINGSKENSNPNVPTPPGSAKNSRNGGSEEGTFNTSINSDKLGKNSPRARSSPNLATLEDDRLNKDKYFHNRSCKACETKTTDDCKLPKPEYKMAFKAGVPNSKSNSNSGSQVSYKTNSSKALHIPKPKTPFAKKGYAINTLAPPFSLWPGTSGMDYPEHWRLASVYQQSYKPIELRKNPMIKGIFR